jgi:hypothetical protein
VCRTKKSYGSDYLRTMQLPSVGEDYDPAVDFFVCQLQVQQGTPVLVKNKNGIPSVFTTGSEHTDGSAFPVSVFVFSSCNLK